MNTIAITVDGPYLVKGQIPLTHQHIVTDAQGGSLTWRQGQTVALPATPTYALCRCGQSGTKPFCDGSHQRAGFNGTETATRVPYAAQAERTEGPAMVLEDAKALCAFARFCELQGQVWKLVLESDRPAAAKLVEQQAGDCPGGRLVAKQRSNGQPREQTIEPRFEASIGLVQDSAKGVSGPLWVRGGVAVMAADGYAYEVRNRVALCRCGASGNKPFCDGTHVSAGFRDRN
ncbi:MAG: CDGSH iron-sulfur domain-containing protein [Rhodoferax sp.]|nr:CDGSH iron-sulfur domain-containing protein [Rhodoferax sp.]